MVVICEKEMEDVRGGHLRIQWDLLKNADPLVHRISKKLSQDCCNKYLQEYSNLYREKQSKTDSPES